MLEILLNEIKQGLLELGRFFCLVYLVWYFVAVLWFIVNPRVSWLYRVNYYSNNSTKDSYISSWNVFQYKFLKMIVIIFYSIIEPMEVILRLPKAIKRGHATTASRNTIITETLEKLPLKKVNKNLGLWFNKYGEWYNVYFDEVWIFVGGQPSHKNVKRFYDYINNKILEYSGNQLMLTFPEYRRGEIHVLYMKIVEVKK
ncbi:TPA: hypothetical protein U1311_001484 [Streptococcus suis]|nr:hypothetical protein [Streptococcus suis]HEM5176067.1 hypothetical protein [Streptococcus suis]HEM5192424.1 hypothetical protein [Streptococcus suis]